MLEGRVKFYDVIKCGYYRRGEANAALCGLPDCLNKLNIWARDNRSMINSSTYQADPDSGVYNTYFCDLAKNETTGDSVLILWNEIANDNGVMYGMSPNTQPGATQMLQTNFGNDPVIPGFPSYFWFMPGEGVVVSIRFDHSIFGKSNLERYLQGFIENKSSYRVLGEDGSVIGYSSRGRFVDGCEKLNPRLTLLSKKQNEVEQQIYGNILSINKVIKKEVLTYAVADQRRTIERFFSNILDNTPENIEQRTVTHEFPFRPTEGQVAQMIRHFRETDGQGPLRNLGFGFSDGKTIMLDGTNVSFSYEFNIRARESHIIPAARLLTAVTNARAALLGAAQ